MAICGFLMPGLRRCSKNPDRLFTGPYRKRLIFAVLGLSAFIILTGCMPAIRYGSPPKIEHLQSLKTGVSSTSDVLLALGEPRGYGTARFSPSLTPRKIWFYEYTEAEGKHMRLKILKILLVYFDQELYDGYLWFSSGQLLEKAN